MALFRIGSTITKGLIRYRLLPYVIRVVRLCSAGTEGYGESLYMTSKIRSTQIIVRQGRYRCRISVFKPVAFHVWRFW
jgi:hypothetical protein